MINRERGRIWFGLTSPTLILLLVSACATPGVKTGKFSEEVGETRGSLFTGFLNAQEADPLFENYKARLIFLINAVDPPVFPDDQAKDPRDLAGLELYQLEARLQDSLNKAESTPGRGKQMRNNMQSQLVGRSNLECAQFSAKLQRLQSDSGFFFTSTTALLAGLGAIFVPSATVRALSGAAAITAGVGAAYSSAMFHEKTISVLSKAIDTKRKRFYEEMMAPSREKDIQTYVFGDAIRDADTYHSFCNIVHAFAETEEALAKRDEISSALREMNKVAVALDGTLVFDRKTGGLNVAKDLTLSTRSFENAKGRKTELLARIDKLKQDAEQTQARLDQSPEENKLLLTGLGDVQSVLDKTKTDLTDLVNAQEEKKASDIADSLRNTFDEWINAPPGGKKDVLEKQLAAKHVEAKHVADSFGGGLEEVANKVQGAAGVLERIKNGRKLTVTNNIHATARTLTKDGWKCDDATCVRAFPDKTEVQLVVESKGGAPVSPKWGSTCPNGKLVLTANVTCIIDLGP